MTVRTKSAKHLIVIALALLAAMLLFVLAAQPARAATKAPERVTVIKATADYNSITLHWKAAARATSYIIYRSDYKYGIYTEMDSIKGTTYVDEDLKTGKALWYKIRAVNDSGRSMKSPRISAVPALQKPVLKAKAAGEGIYLKLSKVEGADGYVIYRDGESMGAQKSRVCLDDDVYADKAHQYKAVAYCFVDRKVVASDFSKGVFARRPGLDLRLTGDQDIEDLYQGEDFDVKGIVRSNTTIESIKVGVVSKVDEEWQARYSKKDLDTMEFDLEKADEKISFEELEQGEYYYKVVVGLKGGSEKVLLNRSFSVTEPPANELITAKALECAWPYGTPRSRARYGGGSRVPAYTEALQIAYGSRKGWSRQTAAGASCDVFVGTVIRTSGYDTKFPRGLDDVPGYCRNNTDKWENLGALSISEMQPGDVVYQRWKSGAGHISIYLGDNRVANAHYVSKVYGIVEKASSKIKSPGRCREFNVYRAIQ